MRFEEALKSMREGKVVKCSYGEKFKLKDGCFWCYIGCNWVKDYYDIGVVISSEEILAEDWEIL